jgi:hypothetical protein
MPVISANLIDNFNTPSQRLTTEYQLNLIVPDLSGVTGPNCTFAIAVGGTKSIDGVVVAGKVVLPTDKSCISGLPTVGLTSPESAAGQPLEPVINVKKIFLNR